MRHDIVEYFASRSRADRIQAANFSLLEELQNNLRLEPDMAGWTQVGGDKTLPTDIFPEREEDIRKQSLLAYYRQPHGRGALKTLVDLTVGGKGAIVDFHEYQEDALRAIDTWWRQFRKINKFFSFQVEMARRAHRDGGYIIQKFVQDDSPIKIRFRELDSLGTPDHPDGIETDKNDVEEFVAFHFKTKDGGTETVDAEDIIYYRNDVDRNVKTGRVTLESGLPLITMHRKWLDARLALNLVRSSVAIVQEVQGSSSDLLRLRNAQMSSKRSDRETDKSKMLRPATILRGLPGVKYSMLSPNLDARDAAEDGRHILTSLGVGTGLPDMIVTGDFSKSNFASAVVAQNPMIRRVEVEQGFLSEVLSEIVDWVLVDGLEKGKIPQLVDDKETNERRPVDIEYDIVFPPIIRRDFSQDTNGYVNLKNMGVISDTSIALQMGLNPDRERELQRRERIARIEDPTIPTDNDGQNNGDDTVGNPDVPSDRKRNNGKLLAPKDPSERRPRQNIG